jgi:hypothetical protein
MSLEPRRQPRACEDLAHRRIARENLRDESVGPLGARVLSKYAKQDRSEAMTLELVGGHESHGIDGSANAVFSRPKIPATDFVSASR